MTLKPVPTLVEIEYHDPRKGTEYLEGVHQILMVSQNHLCLTHGSDTATLAYNVVKEIRVRFKNDTTQDV